MSDEPRNPEPVDPDDAADPNEVEGEDESGPPAVPNPALAAIGRFSRQAAASAPKAARTTALGFSITFAGLTFSLPWILFFWIFGFLVGVLAIGETLERTEGLDPTTFGAGFVLAVVGLIGLSLLVAAAGYGKDPESGEWRRTRPTGPGIVPGGLLILLSAVAAASEGNGTDLPDVLTTGLFLALWLWILVVMPLWLAAAASAWHWKTFRWASKGPYRAGLVTGLCFGLGFLSTLQTVNSVLLLDEEPDLPEELEDFFDALDRAPDADGFMEFNRFLLTAGADAVYTPQRLRRAELPPPAPPIHAPPPPTDTRFADCVEELTLPPPQPPESDMAVARLTNRVTRREIAEEIVQETVLRVCERQVHGEVANLAEYFSRAVSNNRRREYRKWNREVACGLEGFDPTYTAAPAGGSEWLDIDRALCRITAGDRELLRYGLQGYDHKELAVLLDTSPAAARQRLSRARKAFHKALH